MNFFFDEDDWAEITPSDKKALRIFSRVALGYESLSKAPGVGVRSMEALISKGLAEEGKTGLHGRTFKINGKGYLALEWMKGNHQRELKLPD